MFKRLRCSLHKRRHPARYRILPALLQQQSLSRTELLSRQKQDLNKIIRFSIEHTDYYKNKYAGLSAGDLNNFEITQLPILHKHDLIQHRENMVSDIVNRENIRLGHTGGSTGNPLSFYYDDYKTELMRAGMSRSYIWSGWQPGEKILNFWGAKQDIKAHKLKNTYREFTAAEKTIAAWEYAEAELYQWVCFIKNYKPVLLQGYASILADVAAYILENKISMPRSLKGIYSTAEVLYDWQRELMQRAFNCKVYNQYGCREIPNIGVECSQGNIHVFTDMVYLESINNNGENKLIITSLTNYLMPMIRYENGDNGKLKLGQCACGSTFPMMEMGVCRSNDFIKTANGNKIAPSYFNRLLDGLTEIKQYQFVQTQINQLNININAKTRLDAAILKTLKETIKNDLGEDMQVAINYVDKIERSRSGKHRFVICEFE